MSDFKKNNSIIAEYYATVGDHAAPIPTGNPPDTVQLLKILHHQLEVMHVPVDEANEVIRAIFLAGDRTALMPSLNRDIIAREIDKNKHPT